MFLENCSQDGTGSLHLEKKSFLPADLGSSDSETGEPERACIGSADPRSAQSFAVLLRRGWREMKMDLHG